MTDNPWQPIDTMPLSTVGTNVDVQDDRRLYSGVRASGLRYERDVIEERQLLRDGRTFSIGHIRHLTITHTTGTIHANLEAKWRPHVEA